LIVIGVLLLSQSGSKHLDVIDESSISTTDRISSYLKTRPTLSSEKNSSMVIRTGDRKKGLDLRKTRMEFFSGQTCDL